nr:hypothetical protein Iba_chr08aCG9780 [Ipomoea batatas]
MSRDFSVTLSYFQKRFARLLDKSFRSMDYKLAMRNAFTYMKLLRVKNLEHRLIVTNHYICFWDERKGQEELLTLYKIQRDERKGQEELITL